LLDLARASLAVAGLMCLGGSDALAHCFVGARFFPATLAIDDPCVADEMSLPATAASPRAPAVAHAHSH
jgi:hypothetical protein